MKGHASLPFLSSPPAVLTSSKNPKELDLIYKKNLTSLDYKRHEQQKLSMHTRFCRKQCSY